MLTAHAHTHTALTHIPLHMHANLQTPRGMRAIIKPLAHVVLQCNSHGPPLDRSLAAATSTGAAPAAAGEAAMAGAGDGAWELVPCGGCSPGALKDYLGLYWGMSARGMTLGVQPSTQRQHPLMSRNLQH